MPKDVCYAPVVVASLSRFFGIGELPAREYLATLDDADATLLWKCLRRRGWWFPDDQHSAQERLVWWLFRDDVTWFDFSDGPKRERIETPKERLDVAYGSMESLAKRAMIPSHSCLSVANFVRGKLQVLESDQLPLGSSVRQLGSPDDFQSDICSFIRFDGESLNDALNAAAIQLGLRPGKLHWQEATTGHWFTTERRAFDDVRYLLTGWRDVLEREIRERGELPKGWEATDTTWPDCPIKSVEILREWLLFWLDKIHRARSSDSLSRPESYLDDVQRELRNTRRAMREPWGIPLPAQFKAKPADIIEAEEQLVSVIDLLGATTSDPQTATVGIVDDTALVIAKTPDGEQQPSDWTVERAIQKGEDYIARHDYPGVRPLAKLIGNCPPSTMHNAVHRSDRLRADHADYMAVRASRKNVESLSQANSDALRQERELSPDEGAALATDELFHRLIDAASPEERAKLHCMTSQQRLELVAAVGNDQHSDQESRKLRQKLGFS